MLRIYGLPSCDTCRKARQWLTAHGKEYTFHDLRAEGLDIETLERWSRSLDWQQLLNTHSITWRKVPEVDREGLTPGKALSLMLEQPTLVKRPVLEQDDVVVVGFSPISYQKLLK